MDPDEAARFIATGVELLQRVDEVLAAYEKMYQARGTEALDHLAELYAACHNLREARSR